MLIAIALATAPSPAAELVRAWPAPEARQGVAAGRRYIYVVDNSQIGKYERASGRRVALWTGDPARFPHLNSCTVLGRKLVCAASNYPATPMQSSVEVFDRKRMRHERSIPLAAQGGSLTWVDRKDGAWWAGFANYDGKGGEPGRDHRASKLVKFDRQWRPLATWTYPASVLERLAPRSTSGGVWGKDGRLYVTGHDRTEAYVLEVPRKGSVLEHVATVSIAAEGQAIDFDPRDRRTLFGIRRGAREVVAMRLPAN